MIRTRLLVCRVGATAVALREAAVRRILPLPHLHRPPALPEPLAGFADVAGEAVAVLSLARLFGDAATPPGLYDHLLLMRAAPGEPPLALLVDRVDDVVAVAPEHILPVDRADTLNGCVEAEVEHGGALVHLLDDTRILLAAERERLAAHAADAQARIAAWGAPT